MIITCNKCNKSFNVNSDLIPNKGRLVECSGCNYQWFFKKKILVEPLDETKISSSSILKDPSNLDNKKTEIITKKNEGDKVEIIPNLIDDLNEKKENQNDDNTYKIPKKINLLNLIIVFIISFAAIIVLIDTFEQPISKYVPNIEFILYNLYESIKDIKLFFNDLI